MVREKEVDIDRHSIVEQQYLWPPSSWSRYFISLLIILCILYLTLVFSRVVINVKPSHPFFPYLRTYVCKSCNLTLTLIFTLIMLNMHVAFTLYHVAFMWFSNRNIEDIINLHWHYQRQQESDKWRALKAVQRKENVCESKKNLCNKRNWDFLYKLDNGEGWRAWFQLESVELLVVVSWVGQCIAWS